MGVKLLLAGTAALAIHARLRLIPQLTDDNLSGLAWHIRGITALAIAFVVVGGLIGWGAWAAPQSACRAASRGRQHQQQQTVALRVEQPGLGAERFLPRRIVHAGA